MIRYRRKGLPKRLRQIPGGVPGLVSACNVHIHGETPAAKVAFFKDRKSMRHFYAKILPRYMSDAEMNPKTLERNASGCVGKLWTKDNRDRDFFDRNYFCIVLLVEGCLTAEILCHEACHVGFAWEAWTQGKSPFPHPENREENVCYPAGIFLDQVLRFIKEKKLREV